MALSISLRLITETAIAEDLRKTVFKIDGLHVSVIQNFSARGQLTANFVQAMRDGEFHIAFPLLLNAIATNVAARQITDEVTKIISVWPSSMKQSGFSLTASSRQEQKHGKLFRPALVIKLPRNIADELLTAFKKDAVKITAVVQSILSTFDGIVPEAPPTKPKRKAPSKKGAKLNS